jgi:hypothetical protein
MKSIMFAAAAVALLATAAQADIIYTDRGCRETGVTLRNNGGAYPGLAHCPRPELWAKVGDGMKG